VKPNLLIYLFPFFSWFFIRTRINKHKQYIVFAQPCSYWVERGCQILGQYFGLSHTNIASFHNARFFLEGRLRIFKESTQLNLATGFAYERDDIGVLTENNWSFFIANHFKF
jgi:hypothetical protein